MAGGCPPIDFIEVADGPPPGSPTLADGGVAI
jgi:hypothetical protein